MKILQFVPRFSPLSQTFIYNLVLGLSAAQPDTRVLTFERENPELRPFEAVDILSLPEVGFAGHIETLLPFTKPWLYRAGFGAEHAFDQALIAYLEERRPDVFHAHFATEACAVATACEALNIPLVVSLRGYDASRVLNEKRWRRAYERLFSRVRAVVLVTKEMHPRIAPFVPEAVPILTIHAGKNAEDYHFQQRTGPLRRLLTIGRLVEKKGHLDAIRAVQKARQMGADLRLEIIGEGEQRPELEAFIKSENLGDFVELIGELPHEAVKHRLDQADAFILACKTPPNGDKEGVPNVLKEAQLMGLPIISTHHAGIPFVVPKENHSWLAAENDWERLGELASALSKLDAAGIEKNTLLARRHVEEHFSLDGEITRHLRLYEEILS